MLSREAAAATTGSQQQPLLNALPMDVLQLILTRVVSSQERVALAMSSKVLWEAASAQLLQAGADGGTGAAVLGSLLTPRRWPVTELSPTQLNLATIIDRRAVPVMVDERGVELPSTSNRRYVLPEGKWSAPPVTPKGGLKALKNLVVSGGGSARLTSCRAPLGVELPCSADIRELQNALSARHALCARHFDQRLLAFGNLCPLRRRRADHENVRVDWSCFEMCDTSTFHFRKQNPVNIDIFSRSF